MDYDDLSREEKEEIAKEALLRLLRGTSPDEAITEALRRQGTPILKKLQIDRQWVDAETGNLMASGTVTTEDGETYQHTGALQPVMLHGKVAGYTLSMPGRDQIAGQDDDSDDTSNSSKTTTQRKEAP